MAMRLGSQVIFEIDDKPFNEKDDKSREPLHSTHEFEPSEGGWGWVVCATSLVANGTVFGILNTFGILYVPLRERYAGQANDVSFKTAWVGSVCTGLTFFMSMTASILTDQIGIRKVSFFGALLGTIGILASAFVQQLELLYLTFGVLLGVGGSLVYGPSLTILGHYFKKRIGLVNGIVSCGSAILTIALSFALPELLKAVGLKYTFVFLSGLFFMLMWLTLTWKPQIHKETNLAHLALSTESVALRFNECYSFTKKYLNLKIWRNKKYVIWVLSTGVALFGYFVPFVHLIKHTSDVFPGSNGNLLVMCLSITSGIGRLICGKIADFRRVDIVLLQQVAFVILGATTMCIPFAANFASLIGICLIMGICDGMFVCLLGPIAFDIVGHTNANQAIGFLLGVISVPMMTGPPVAGFLYDSLGSYKIAFHVAGTPPIIGALLMFLMRRVSQKKSVRELEMDANLEVEVPDGCKEMTLLKKGGDDHIEAGEQVKLTHINIDDNDSVDEKEMFSDDDNCSEEITLSDKVVNENYLAVPGKSKS